MGNSGLMNWARNIFDFYLNSSIHVALGVVALTALTVLHFDLEPDYLLLSFVFFGTITGYNFVKYAGIAKLHHRSLAKNLKVIQIFSLGCFLALCYLAFQISIKVLLVGGVLGFFTLLYALPVFSSQKNLRSVAGLKVFVIAIIWAGVTVFFPIADADLSFETDSVLEYLQRFLFVLILILPFEIRDLKYDKEDLRTIPQMLGVRRSKQLGYLLISMWVVLELCKGISTSDSVAALICAAGITGFVVFKSDEDQPPYFSSFWVEGIPVLWFLLLLLFELS